MASSYDRVRHEDWVALLRISAEVADLPVSAVDRRKHLLAGLCRHVGATIASVFDGTATPDEFGPDGIAHPGSVTSVNTTAADHTVLRQFYTSTMSGRHNPLGQAMTRCVMRHGTVLRGQFADDRTWLSSPYFEHLLRPLGVVDQLSCKVPLPNGKWAGLALMRATNDSPFEERHRQVMALFHEHAAHLYAVPKTALAAGMDALPPRLRPVLRALLDGDAEKQVAVKLGISRHTVHQYVKLLYKQLDVTSRGELFARLRVAEPG